jgi:protocatechuate 3,4-dioxygenase beta subunit
VSGLTCGPIKHAKVDFWQADPQGHFDRTGFRFRGYQFTDANGRFRLETLVPGPTASAAPRIYVRVEVEKQPPFTTQLFFPDDPTNKSEAAFKPDLVMKVTTSPAGSTGVFDIVLNI